MAADLAAWSSAAVLLLESGLPVSKSLDSPTGGGVMLFSHSFISVETVRLRLPGEKLSRARLSSAGHWMS